MSEHRCRIGAGDPNRKPRREDGSAPSTKRDPLYRPGQWHRQRGMIQLGRPERQQMPLQRAHAKTTGRNKSLQRSQVPKSTCQAERVGRQSNKKLPTTDRNHPTRARSGKIWRPRNRWSHRNRLQAPRVRDLTTPFSIMIPRE